MSNTYSIGDPNLYTLSQSIERLADEIAKLPEKGIVPGRTWTHVGRAVPPEGVCVLLTGWAYCDPEHAVYIGHRIGNRYLRHSMKEEFPLSPIYWMNIPEEGLDRRRMHHE